MQTNFELYKDRVLMHLRRLRWQGHLHQRTPNVHEMAWARSSGISPRKYAEWWVRHHAE